MQVTRVILQAVLAIGLLSRVQSAPIADPIRDFLETPDPDRDSAASHPKSITKLELDITGEGKKAICLSAYGDKSFGCYWTIYLPLPGGYKAVRTAADDHLIGFSPDKLFVGYIDEIKARGLLTYSGRIKWGFALDAYWISKGVLLHKTVNTVQAEEGGQNSPLLEKYFPDSKKPGSAVYPVERISLDAIKSRGYSLPASFK